MYIPQNMKRSIQSQAAFKSMRIGIACLAASLCLNPDGGLRAAEPQWEACGWGGGGYFFSAVYHPTKDGVIYMGGDVGGAYKTTDHGLNWRRINNGLTNYGVFSLAVDRSHPDTVFAVTVGGLHKSTDAGETWQLIPKTGRNDLRITAERHRSVRAVAVAPDNGNNVYAASPGGRVYKSIDGGQTWAVTFEKKNDGAEPDVLALQFGKVTAGYFGVISLPLTLPSGVKSEDTIGIGFTFKGDKTAPKQFSMILRMSDVGPYRSKNISDCFKNDQWQDVVLKAEDFTVDPDFARSNPEKAAGMPEHPNFAKIKSIDVACSGNLPAEASIAKFKSFFFAVTHAPDGREGTVEKPVLVTARDFVNDKNVTSNGNVHLGGAMPGGIYAVAVAPKKTSCVVAATEDVGLVLSEDAGQTWRELNTPKRASSAVFAETDPSVMYGSFFTDGIWKSTDMGKTWVRASEGLPQGASILEVAVSPVNTQDVYAIGSQGTFVSNDGGATWKNPGRSRADLVSNPTLHYNVAATPMQMMSRGSNVTIDPCNPKEIFISQDWRPALSGDGGVTWSERSRGADITCVTDIRFLGGKVYVTAMDEGLLVSENDGQSWKQLSPLKHDNNLSGHYWRVAVDRIGGSDRILSSMSSWYAKQRHVVYSQDGGKTFRDTAAGLPDYLLTRNTMWGQGHPRALAVDPNQPNVVYMGIDGDPVDGKEGGGIFKSTDGGIQWQLLPSQPASRRMFNGLAVDPTNSNRIFWGACAEKGGLYRSEDGGNSWTNVFNKDQWIFNLLVTKDGTVYCPGKNLWRSRDHGNTWTKLTNFTGERAVCALEVDPRNSQTIWISTVTWNESSNGAVYKSTDDGNTWNEITGNLAYTKPFVLRFNPNTNELWAGWVGLSKIKQ